MTGLPKQGRPRQEVLEALRDFAAADPDYKSGRLWSLVYWLGEEHEAFMGEAYHAFSSANGLNPTAFKSLKRLETEIIGAVAELFHGPPETCGVVTSGGTESCLLAVKTYRDLARAQRRVKKPEMVLPVTAHVAWLKAAEYFGVRARMLPLDGQMRADVGRLPALVNRNTVMILGSAPDYPHGIIDPIEAMGAIARQRGVPLHVDACVGGFILPFMAMNGRPIPAWDYRVPGVTSISADIHKYGFAAKGASTITYRCSWPPTGQAACSPRRLCSARGRAARTPRPGRPCSISGRRAIAIWRAARCGPSTPCRPASPRSRSFM